MSDKAKELAKQVLDTQQGITPEQLKALIEAEDQTPTPINQVPAEPASAPAPQASTAQPVKTEPVSEPNVLDLIPEKFRAKDVPTSLTNITKSYSDMEADLRKTKDEMANLNKLVQSFMTKEPAYAPPAPVATTAVDGEVDDASFFERPTESTKKVAAQMAAAAIVAYHVQQERQKYVDAFKTKTPDFENYREDMMAILKTRPDLDKDERNLPLVYEMAKQRYANRLQAMKADLGLVQTQQPAASPVDLDALRKAEYLRARDDLIAEVAARRQASGIQGAGPAGSPDSRVQDRVTGKVLSDDDQLIQDMLNSGPKKLTLGE